MRPKTIRINVSKSAPATSPAESDEQRKYRETVETIATNIAMLSEAVSSVLRGPLKRRTLIVLLANSSGLKQHVVESVLAAVESMQADWLNK
jgi:hypothetical protein